MTTFLIKLRPSITFDSIYVKDSSSESLRGVFSIKLVMVLISEFIRDSEENEASLITDGPTLQKYHHSIKGSYEKDKTSGTRPRAYVSI